MIEPKTKRPRISLIAAMAKNRVIGNKNGLPWHLPQDLKRFRSVTQGHCVVMGRKTFESIGKPLPNRTNVVITRQPDWANDGVLSSKSLQSALETARSHEKDEIFIIGGAEIYQQSLSLADRLYLTLIDQEVVGDAFFPDYKKNEFLEISREDFQEPIKFSFVVLDRS